MQSAAYPSPTWLCLSPLGFFGTRDACLLEPQSTCMYKPRSPLLIPYLNPSCFSPLPCVVSSESSCQPLSALLFQQAPPLHSQQTGYSGKRNLLLCILSSSYVEDTVCEQRPAACGHPAVLRSAAREALVDSLRFAEEDTRKQLCGARVSRVQGHKSFHTQS